MFSVWWYYRHPGAQDGRIIVENNCLILQIFEMSDGETRALVMCKSDERLQMVGALLSAHGFSCRELIQEQIAFPMLFRLHMGI
jgi:hypothetical protein